MLGRVSARNSCVASIARTAALAIGNRASHCSLKVWLVSGRYVLLMKTDHVNAMIASSERLWWRQSEGKTIGSFGIAVRYTATVRAVPQSSSTSTLPDDGGDALLGVEPPSM
eukprot:Amastigsp_a2295_27.p4 type:complete len:112 gc:universal Amastigsp_a2295_27:625-290(-)